jgi:hypothetical protein
MLATFAAHTLIWKEELSGMSALTIFSDNN